MSWRAEFKRFLVAASSTILGMMLLCCIAAVDASEDQPNVEPNDLRWDLAENLEFRWTTTDLSAKVIRDQGVDVFERELTISGTLHILELEGFVTIERDRPWILRVLDAHGNAVPCEFGQWSGRWYESNVWLPDSGMRTSWFGPSSLALRFPANPDEPVPSSLGQIVGYVYVLLADEILFLDIPFDPDGGWHEPEPAPDLQICIDPTTPPCPGPLEYIPVEVLPGTPKGLWAFPYRPTTPVPLYSYTTWIRSKSGAPVMALRDRMGLYLRDDYPLGDYAILRTELYDSVEQTSVIVPTQEIKSGVSDVRGTWCRGQMEKGKYDAYDTIRHVIAVHPVEAKIPFVLRDIPILGTEVTDK
ncbi:MAG: hypothetical protein RBS72_08345 [Sedimentisphaerales bacterium]|jgi:hypothetical protein|nr:hypothetical protein [Sedimentisphaerales bacterium]HNY77757.1 hypothetical protein [Sedimentisphaerales bacterium]HOC63501.1 hypothetical protein [Sedimentisphaerales bacterium]HOH63932.1 hypothetical protein [Sedimentisphaerales bacterium]HPY50024.1 hypothetical protein [Sedimentisphaerales bacterium]